MVSLNLKRCGVAGATCPTAVLQVHQQRCNLGWLTCEARHDRCKLSILSLFQSYSESLRFCWHIGRSAFADFEIASATIAQHRSLQRCSIKQSHFQTLRFTRINPINQSLGIRHEFLIRIGQYPRYNDSSTKRCNRADKR
jgi:hypothetical protein